MVIDNVPLNGTMFVQLAVQYCAMVGLGGATVPLSQAWSNVIQIQLKASLREAVSIYRSTLNDYGMKKLPLSDTEIKQVHSKAKALAKASFPEWIRRTANTLTDPSHGGMNQSISLADISSPDSFLSEFKLRRQQLLEHLKAENHKVSMTEMQKVFDHSDLSFQTKLFEKYPIASCLQFVTGTVIPKLVDKPVATSYKEARTPPVVGVAPLGVDTTILTRIEDLLVNGLTEMKSAELDRRSLNIRAENEEKSIELERKFNKQLNDARRKSDLLVSDLKNNYESEISQLKSQKHELQIRVVNAEAEKNSIKQTENEKVMKTNFANVINQQSELILSFLRNGANLTPPQIRELEALTKEHNSWRTAA